MRISTIAIIFLLPSIVGILYMSAQAAVYMFHVVVNSHFTRIEQMVLFCLITLFISFGMAICSFITEDPML